MPLLFLALLSLPLIEIAVLVLVGSHIGVLATLALVIGTGMLGTFLLRAQGFSALSRLRQTMTSGKAPDGQVAEAAMIVLAGIMLIIPGFISDIIGILLFIPFVRRFLIERLARNITVVRPRTNSGDDVVDLDVSEYQRTDGFEENAKRDTSSPWKLPSGKSD